MLFALQLRFHPPSPLLHPLPSLDLLNLRYRGRSSLPVEPSTRLRCRFSRRSRFLRRRGLPALPRQLLKNTNRLQLIHIDSYEIFLSLDELAFEVGDAREGERGGKSGLERDKLFVGGVEADLQSLEIRRGRCSCVKVSNVEETWVSSRPRRLTENRGDSPDLFNPACTYC